MLYKNLAPFDGGQNRPEFVPDPYGFIADKLNPLGGVRRINYAMSNNAPFGNTAQGARNPAQVNFYTDTLPPNPSSQFATGPLPDTTYSRPTPSTQIASTAPIQQLIASLSEDLGSSPQGEVIQPLLQNLLAGGGSDQSSSFSPLSSSVENFGGVNQQQTTAPLPPPLANTYASAVESANAPEQPLANTYGNMFTLPAESFNASTNAPPEQPVANTYGNMYASAAESFNARPTTLQHQQQAQNQFANIPPFIGTGGGIGGLFDSRPRPQPPTGQSNQQTMNTNQIPQGFKEVSEPYLMDGQWFQTFLGFDGTEHVLPAPVPGGVENTSGGLLSDLAQIAGYFL